ncbi:bifunctional UDP-N-acetylglucosamine pyrophosphorylase / Glucosamine-1-phosphate N-acetyltransferase [Burkholderiales bacterium]|nr:MAG: UDP-N-acetylglucosamine diphosphorylase/glucosamine-1-phosphate N-acetyltransferase [Burkholderiales bacterium]CAG1002125.1 bifunctional UDP-N-acetylglucosamine pyrophosphorylase / Glucosamine-1-phosphate N-acetyltransferase [Burkholderiales bacterium]
MPTPLDIVILAAGQGKRMFSKSPKVLQPLAGKPLLAHVLTAAGELSPRSLCVVYGHGGEEVRKVFAEKSLAWALQEPQLGTGHALQQALPHLPADGITLVLYGDVPLLSAATLRALVARCEGAPLAVLSVLLDDPKGYGRLVRDAAGKLQRIVEEKDATAAERALREVNTGIMAAPTASFARWLAQLKNDNAQGEYYLTDVIALAVAEGGEVATASAASVAEVTGVNSKDQLAQLEREFQSAAAQRLMAQGVTLLDPARFDVRGALQCGRDVTIDVGCVFEGEVTLGDGVRIEPYCVLRNVNIAAGTRVAPFSHLEGATLGENCVVGPYARLRPGAVLAREAHVGNFVEVKNSSLGFGSKANHLAYIGDATVGARVNIGAGTITCNYDGVNKHRTVIEDDVFIGSDTQLVAPVTVRRGATLGAGTTLTREAPPDTLTVSRAKQIAVPGWKRPKKV